MKNFKKLLVLFLMGSLAVNYSCSTSNDNAGNPTMTVQPGDQNAKAGDKLTYAVNANSDATSKAGLTKLHIIVNSSNGATIGQAWDSTLSKKPTELGYTFNWTVPNVTTAEVY